MRQKFLIQSSGTGMQSFKCIGLVGRLDSTSTQYSLQRLISFLAKQNVEVLMDEETSSAMPDCELSIVPRSELRKRCDLIVVVGGDGSILSAARSLAGSGVKILGINRGRLGFLADISPDAIEYKLGEILDGMYFLEERFLLECQVFRGGQLISEGIAMNDVVLHPGKFIRMIEFELFIDDEFVYRQRSDGLIISSPTGSTAYALSGGGPIMHPNLDAMVLVPLYPHTLSSRPIVVSGDSKVRLRISDVNNLNPHVTCDGQTHVVSQPGDEIEVYKCTRLAQLIHPKGHSFYQTCRNKLGWASDAGGV